ncbi:DUF3137 domain-containing protein [Parabacteroides sp. OttesenSCG-928-G06]|nr:DUF3137 domain-containing protein [Parabacteroides sp. OttesenSCG-928-K15]MDL2282487.1 DUF3137 domain-containing protein [Parabacteroides sp. OttesenSCG-928-G06]
MKPILSFEELCRQLEPVLGQLEEKQQADRKKKTKQTLIWGGIIVALTLVILCFMQIGTGLMIGVCLLMFMLAIVWSTSSELNQFYKQEVVSHMVATLVDNGNYFPEKGIPEALFNGMDIFSRPDRYKSEDLISGTIDKTSFYFSEAHAERREQRSNGKTTRTVWVTLFKGFLFIADFNKHFEGQTIVTRDTLIKLRGGRVKLENPAFEKKFDVYATDQVEARYILTPSLMERLLNLDEDFDGGMVVSFCDSKIMIAIDNSTNHFEVSSSQKYNTGRMFADYEMITSLIGIVDDLNLNTRIWTKE